MISSNSANFVAELEVALGSQFREWLLGEICAENPSDDQRGVAEWICVNVIADSDHPRSAVAELCHYDPEAGMSHIAKLRSQSGVLPDAFPDLTGDAVLDALSELAYERYPELLLRSGTGFTPSGTGDPRIERATRDAIKDDPDLPFTSSSADTDFIRVSRSTGTSGPVQLAMAGTLILVAAWDLARFRFKEPTLSTLISSVPEILKELRSACRRGKSKILGLTALSGVLLPEEARMEFTEGFIRAARSEDHPYVIRLLHGGSQASKLPDGSEIRIHDTGDILLGAHVHAKTVVNGTKDLDSDQSLRSLEYLQEKVTQVRLAFLMSWADTNPPALIPTWNSFVTAFDPLGGWGWNDLHLFASRTPTLLTQGQVDEWGLWMERLEKVPLPKLGLAPMRILRASAERRDPYDSLIDAVIAWESLFGTEAEITFRVSASIARLIHPAGAKRNELRRKAAGIYGMRSRVVHGVDVPASQVREASQEAIRIALDCIRVVIRERPELIRMSSAERSSVILME